jgi:hypothetical protein
MLESEERCAMSALVAAHPQASEVGFQSPVEDGKSLATVACAAQRHYDPPPLSLPTGGSTRNTGHRRIVCRTPVTLDWALSEESAVAREG